VATQSETIQVSGIRCERCVMRLAHALAWDDEHTNRDAILGAMAKAGFRETVSV